MSECLQVSSNSTDVQAWSDFHEHMKAEKQVNELQVSEQPDVHRRKEEQECLGN